MVVRYKSEIFSVEEIKAKVNGKQIHFDKINENNVVVMLALIDGKIVMERLKRVAVGKRLLEVPAGHIERGENAEEAAKREFEEETGYEASKARLLFTAHMAPGLVNNIHNYFLLSGITNGEVNRDVGEEMNIVLVEPRRALSIIRNGEMVDGKSALLILWANQHSLL